MESLLEMRNAERFAMENPRPPTIGGPPVNTVCRQLAHDLANELGAICSMAQLLEETAEDNTPVRDDARGLREAARHAVELCQQLQSELGGARAAAIPFGVSDVNGVVNRALPVLRSVVAKQVRLVVDLAHDLPLVMANESQLREVILELVKNANHAATAHQRDGGGAITLRTGVLRRKGHEEDGAGLPGAEFDGDAVYFEVCDSGCGMTAETRQNLFDVGFTTKADGRGLGMPSVLRIIRGHSGTVTVQSNAATGTRIRCSLPCYRSSAAPSG
ncbi:HAMP domain-containing sensor histidine kinase [Botrimarina sp.]|uniref:HAMP domain-containing sensor histidine kinase n=1 Tax=Botrimarina sp. TaxID=2795802 RepID=UPI0032EB7106